MFLAAVFLTGALGATQAVYNAFIEHGHELPLIDKDAYVGDINDFVVVRDVQGTHFQHQPTYTMTTSNTLLITNPRRPWIVASAEEEARPYAALAMYPNRLQDAVTANDTSVHWHVVETSTPKRRDQLQTIKDLMTESSSLLMIAEFDVRFTTFAGLERQEPGGRAFSLLRVHPNESAAQATVFSVSTGAYDPSNNRSVLDGSSLETSSWGLFNFDTENFPTCLYPEYMTGEPCEYVGRASNYIMFTNASTQRTEWLTMRSGLTRTLDNNYLMTSYHRGHSDVSSALIWEDHILQRAAGREMGRSQLTGQEIWASGAGFATGYMDAEIRNFRLLHYDSLLFDEEMAPTLAGVEARREAEAYSFVAAQGPTTTTTTSASPVTTTTTTTTMTGTIPMTSPNTQTTNITNGIDLNPIFYDDNDDDDDDINDSFDAFISASVAVVLTVGCVLGARQLMFWRARRRHENTHRRVDEAARRVSLCSSSTAAAETAIDLRSRSSSSSTRRHSTKIPVKGSNSLYTALPPTAPQYDNPPQGGRLAQLYESPTSVLRS